MSFIDVHREVCGGEPICQVLPIDPFTYHSPAAGMIEPTRSIQFAERSRNRNTGWFRIREATVKRFHYDSHAQLRTLLADFTVTYNFASRIKTLRRSHALRAHRKIQNLRAEPVHRQPGPPDAGTEHLEPANYFSLVPPGSAPDGTMPCDEVCMGGHVSGRRLRQCRDPIQSHA